MSHQASGNWTYRKRCNKCLSRERRERDPVKSVFERLKRRSAKLEVPFGFTVECIRCFFSIHREYLELKGNSPSSLHLDRRVNELGYTPQNLRPLVASRNIAKGNRERYGQPDIDPDWDV